MKISELKDRIIYENKIYDILVALGMKNIRETTEYYSCGMPDGDNPKSTIVYKDSLYVDAHTRDIRDNNGSTDLISLIMFIEEIYFTNALRWICSVCGFDYYGKDYEKPALLTMFDEIIGMRSSSFEEEENYVSNPIDEGLLKYFKPVKSRLFYMDGISYDTQKEFDIRYDGLEDRIVIPIKDEEGILVGLKGRLNKKEVASFENKYIYLTKCNKSAILYGLDKAYEHIKKSGKVYVSESEKGVMQAWSNGVKNVVAIGGKIPSRTQIIKLIHLGVDICLCYDDGANIGKDGEIDKNFYKKQKDRFIDGIRLSYISDRKNEILGEKESPFDNMDMWDELLNMEKIIK